MIENVLAVFYFCVIILLLGLMERKNTCVLRLHHLRTTGFKCLKVPRLWAVEAECGVTVRGDTPFSDNSSLLSVFHSKRPSSRCFLNITPVVKTVQCWLFSNCEINVCFLKTCVDTELLESVVSAGVIGNFPSKRRYFHTKTFKASNCNAS